MTEEQNTLRKAIRNAERERAKARRRRDIIASAHLDGDERATLAIIAAATLAVVRAEREVSEAKHALMSTIRP